MFHPEMSLGHVLREVACNYLPCGRSCEAFLGWVTESPYYLTLSHFGAVQNTNTLQIKGAKSVPKHPLCRQIVHTNRHSIVID